ncbi:MAG: protein kinase [Acidobacteriota bacterium]
MESIGKYEILEEIGQGGFGTVYRGKDTVLKRLVAVKTCLSDEEEIRARFQREAEVVASLQHPNITIVHDFGTHDEVPYLVQEYLSGEDLTDVIARKEELSLDTKVNYLVQAARGLGHAHKHGIVHRDVKPGNIRRLDDGSIKVMDFGIAKLTNLQTKLTRTGTMLGTAAYLAPEQLGDGEIGPQCDIFSFGVLAYELLAYQRPFEGTTISALLYQVMSQDAAPLREVCDCTESLSVLIDHCLRKEASDRPASFDEVIRCLTEPEHVQTANVASGEMPTIIAPAPRVEAATQIVAPDSQRTVLADAPETGTATATATVSTISRQDVSRAFVPASKGLLWVAIAFSAATLIAMFLFQRSLREALAPGDVDPAPQVAKIDLPTESADRADDASEPTGDVEPAAVPDQPSKDSSTKPTVKEASKKSAPPASKPEARRPVKERDEPRSIVQESSDEKPAAKVPEPSKREPRIASAATGSDSPSRPAASDAVPREPVKKQAAPMRDAPRPAVETRTPVRTAATAPVATSSVAAAQPATLDRPAPKPVPKAALPVDESPAIRTALDAYRKAFDSRDLGALKAIWPSLTGDQLDKMDRSFRSVQAQSMTLQNCRIVAQAATATADCSVFREVKPKAGRRQSATTQTVFRLVKSNGSWFVESI